MHGRGDMYLTTSTYSLNITKKRCVSLLDNAVFITDVGLNKWGLERRMTLEEERASKEAREERRVQIQVLNEHVAVLCGSESLKSFFSLPDFKCNIIVLLTDCILYMKGLIAARIMPQRWLVQGMRKRS